MSDLVTERIDAWEAAGLIDAGTAERLRAAEADRPPDADPRPAAEPAAAAPSPIGTVSSFFGPAVTVVEAFSYLGGAFVLAAWGALIVRLADEAALPTNEWILVAGLAIPAVGFFLIGIVLHGRSRRLGRAARAPRVLSLSFVASGVTANVAIVADGALPAVAGAIAGVVASIAYRWYHPSLLTQAALILSIAGVVEAWLVFLDEALEASPGLAIGGTTL